MRGGVGLAWVSVESASESISPGRPRRESSTCIELSNYCTWLHGAWRAHCRMGWPSRRLGGRAAAASLTVSVLLIGARDEPTYLQAILRLAAPPAIASHAPRPKTAAEAALFLGQSQSRHGVRRGSCQLKTPRNGLRSRMRNDTIGGVCVKLLTQRQPLLLLRGSLAGFRRTAFPWPPPAMAAIGQNAFSPAISAG